MFNIFECLLTHRISESHAEYSESIVVRVPAIYKLQVLPYNQKMSVAMVDLLYCTNYTNMLGIVHYLR
jgi:hypothetical protein